MSSVYIASDYAGMRAGSLGFYYGYEETMPENASDDYDGEVEWCFLATDGTKPVMRLPYSQLGTEASQWDCSDCLLAGIAKYLEASTNGTSPANNKDTMPL